MSHVQNSSAAAVAVVAAVPTTLPERPRRVDLGACILAACDRDADAAEIVAKRLRPRLVTQIERALGKEHAQDAEDVLDALFVEMLDGGVTIAEDVRPVRCLMRVARNFARRHLRELRGNWGEQD
jgi:DNA-directed RNA polymerase specialized sigma24 family protein